MESRAGGGGEGLEVESWSWRQTAHAGIPGRGWGANPYTAGRAWLTSVLRTDMPEKHSEGPVRTFPF